METKFGAPTKYDTEPYKTIWKQQLDNGIQWYIQVSKDKNSPIWISIGEFFTKIYQSCLGDGLFIEEQMDLFEKTEESNKEDIKKHTQYKNEQ